MLENRYIYLNNSLGSSLDALVCLWHRWQGENSACLFFDFILCCCYRFLSCCIKFCDQLIKVRAFPLYIVFVRLYTQIHTHTPPHTHCTNQKNNIQYQPASQPSVRYITAHHQISILSHTHHAIMIENKNQKRNT